MTLSRIAITGFVLACLGLSSGCVVERDRDTYHEGYYDREHARWYHDHEWHECVEHDEHCH